MAIDREYDEDLGSRSIRVHLRTLQFMHYRTLILRHEIWFVEGILSSLTIAPILCEHSLFDAAPIYKKKNLYCFVLINDFIFYVKSENTKKKTQKEKRAEPSSENDSNDEPWTPINKRHKMNTLGDP